jgi:hypothetical protein
MPAAAGYGITRVDELTMLKEQAEYIRTVLQDIEGRVNELQQDPESSGSKTRQKKRQK